MNRVSLLIAIALLSLAILYVLAIYRTLWYAGDSMIGFSPLALLWIPATIFLGILGMLISKARRSWIIAASTIVTLALMVSPWFWYEWVLENSWRTSIEQYSEVNKTALRNTDSSSAMLSDVDFPYEGKTVVVPDFRWYCEQQIAALKGSSEVSFFARCRMSTSTSLEISFVASLGSKIQRKFLVTLIIATRRSPMMVGMLGPTEQLRTRGVRSNLLCDFLEMRLSCISSMAAPRRSFSPSPEEDRA